MIYRSHFAYTAHAAIGVYEHCRAYWVSRDRDDIDHPLRPSLFVPESTGPGNLRSSC